MRLNKLNKALFFVSLFIFLSYTNIFTINFALGENADSDSTKTNKNMCGWRVVGYKLMCTDKSKTSCVCESNVKKEKTIVGGHRRFDDESEE